MQDVLPSLCILGCVFGFMSLSESDLCFMFVKHVGSLFPDWLLSFLGSVPPDKRMAQDLTAVNDVRKTLQV